MKNRILLLVAVVIAAAAGWWARDFSSSRQAAQALSPDSKERRVRFYQSPMHPWIKSDQPGKCTICGMELVPIYEGEKPFESREGVVALSSNQITVVQVQTTEARRQPLRRTLRVAGSIDENDQRHRVLSAYADGRIDKLFVNQLGAEVAEGQPLVALYSPTLLTAVREHLALGRGSALTAASAARLRQYGLTEAQIRRLPETFGDTNILVELVAPVAGTVVLKDVYEGQYVKEGDKLMELADFSTMWFVFDAYERDLAWLRPGQSVEVTTASLPGRVLTNVISFIDPTLRDDTRSARVRVEIPNPLIDADGRSSRLLRHRVSAEGRIRVEIAEVLAVPRTAVLSPGSQPVVYVELDNGTYEQRVVSLGRAGDETWEILDGISEGERIVTRGNLLIDAQAQLNRAAMGPASHPGAPDATLSPPGRTNRGTDGPIKALSPAQAAALRELLVTGDGLREALAADDLGLFNELAPRLHGAVAAATAALPDIEPWRTRIRDLRRVSHLDPAPNLREARRQFHALSLETVALAKRLRAGDTNFAGLKIYQCPMTKRAFPGAPAKAEWLQFQAPVRNPYFGGEMLDCGTEVRP